VILIRPEVGDFDSTGDSGQVGGAIEEYQKTLALNPNFAPAHLMLGMVYEQKGMIDRAVAEYLRAGQLFGDSPENVNALKQAFETGGERGYWEKALQQSLDAKQRHQGSSVEIAGIYARLGQPEQALAWLEKACEERDNNVLDLKVRPLFRSLWQEPRFKAVLKKVGLEK